MNLIAEQPLFTQEFDRIEDFIPAVGSTYLYGVTSEPRSEFALALARRSTDVNFVEISERSTGVFETDMPEHSRIVTRRRDMLNAFLSSLGDGTIYVDITGMGHATWAPIVKVCVERSLDLKVVYLEPEAYSVTPSPDAGEIFDLRERIEGIAPIPLFASLDDRKQEEICFIPLLGFEGGRFLHMLNAIEPLESKVFPVIGAPGFRPHYPLDALIGNAIPLEMNKAIRHVRLAQSNCPFSAYYAIEEIAQRNAGHQMKIGLIGTKPHALGGVLFAIFHSDSAEIVYDNVKRKRGRSYGAARALVYDVASFLEK